MPVHITHEHITQLIAIESGVHYAELPPPEREAFVVHTRPSPVLLSAPHGALTHRNRENETWHQEDEYTAGMALLLGALCGVAAIATLWRTAGEDPNYHPERCSAYKRALKQVVETQHIRWVIDLHGASANTSLIGEQHWVDLGTRRDLESLSRAHRDKLTHLTEAQLGAGRVHYNGYPAAKPHRTITAYSHGTLGLEAVQVEMKPGVRVPFRRSDASLFAQGGPFAAQPEHVMGMVQALADFVEYLLALA